MFTKLGQTLFRPPFNLREGSLFQLFGRADERPLLHEVKLQRNFFNLRKKIERSLWFRRGGVFFLVLANSWREPAAGAIRFAGYGPDMGLGEHLKVSFKAREVDWKDTIILRMACSIGGGGIPLVPLLTEMVRASRRAWSVKSIKLHGLAKKKITAHLSISHLIIPVLGPGFTLNPLSFSTLGFKVCPMRLTV